MWEFGCAQLHLGESFVDSMQRDYMNDFGIEIVFFESMPEIVDQYSFIKEHDNGNYVPGLIFVAKYNTGKLKYDNSKHTHVEWLDERKLFKINKEDAVTGFHNNIKKALKYVDEKNK